MAIGAHTVLYDTGKKIKKETSRAILPTSEKSFGPGFALRRSGKAGL